MTATSAIQKNNNNRVMARTQFKLNAWSAAGILFSGLATIALCVSIVSGLEFVNHPFPGFLVTQSLVVNAGQATGEVTWTGHEAGIDHLDKIIRVDDITFEGNVNPAVTFSDVIASSRRGEIINLGFERLYAPGEALPDYCNAITDRTAICDREVELMQFPAGDVMVYFLFPTISAMIILGMGIMMLYFRGHTRTGFVAVLLSCLTATYLGGLFDAGTYGRIILLWIMMPPMLGAALITLGLLLPVPLRSFKRPILQAIPLLIGLLLGLYFAYQYTTVIDPRTDNIAQLSTITGITGIFMFFAIQLIIQRPLSVTEHSRDQNNALLIGTAVVLIVSIIWAGQHFLLVNTDLSVVISFEAITPVYIFPIAAILYALLQHRTTVDTDRMITHNLSRLIMLGALITCVYLLILGSSLVLQQALNVNDPVFIAIIVMITALLIIPFRNRLQTRIDRLYFRERHNYQQHIETFTEELADSPDYAHAVAAFQKHLQDTVAPASLFIFLLQNEENRYEALPDTGRTTDIHFDASSATAELLATHEDAISLQDGQPFPRALWSDRARLKVLQASVLAGLPGTDRLNGFVIIGHPRSGVGTYTYEQIRFINTLVSQFAIETERARVIDSLERKVRELNVISQVGQAVNLTVDFDDLLELISTQTGKLLDASYFYILLYEAGIQQLRFVFFQEANERYENKENVRWTLDNGLFSEIIKNSEALRVGNYRMEMEARRAEIRHESDDLRAWMGVRLTAGRSTREVIGVIAAARMSHEGYSDDEFKIFRDIATLAAASIDKARLFDRTLARERQLTVLNDITRQLVAAEANVERLLELIMSSAVDILNAEAGSLLLNTEDRTGDLEFRVVIGGATHLEGTRWKAGEGVVGQVATTGKPHISNNVDDDPDHTRDADASFHVKSLIAVPLIAKDNVIGVLEVLNKNDGTIFLEEDRAMLTTFAGQAAVAIENARLLRSQDMQLGERVKELETLEQIDTQLNRARYLDEVATITVNSATTTLKAQAGALGIVHEDAFPPYLEIVALTGYEKDEYPDNADGMIWSLESGIVGRVMRTKTADIVADTDIDPDYNGNLRNCQSQLTMPMMSGTTINAILILERTADQTPFTLTEWLFAQRLAEHASIAISNAQLNAALLSANRSKSEFMGFAAHELKNPLTPIKGYADIMRKGALGELTEQQKNFIEIIHSNANRMETIITDLRDAARLEGNQFTVELAPMDIRHAVIASLQPFVHVLDEKNQELINDVPEDLPLVMGDESRLIQVITNLVSNAHKYSPQNTTITIKGYVIDKYVDKDGHAHGKMVAIGITDQGIGMSEEDLQKLFRERYFRTERAQQMEKGTGLGMMLTYGIMERHSGDILVESEEDKGSTFTVVVPIVTEATLEKLRLPEPDASGD